MQVLFCGTLKVLLFVNEKNIHFADKRSLLYTKVAYKKKIVYLINMK